MTADPWVTSTSDAERPDWLASSGPGLGLLSGLAATVEESRGATLSARAATDREALEVRLRELLRLDGFAGALEVAESLLAAFPDHSEAASARLRCIAKLEAAYRSRLGNLQTAPSVRVPPDEVIWLDLDHRAGFVLAQVDGVASYDDIAELCGMGRLEALRILCELLRREIIR